MVPVRPALKAQYPLQDFAEYCQWQTPQGEPFDPWIRTHVRLGGQIIKPAMRSMDITSSADNWSEWTGMAFPHAGQYIVPGLWYRFRPILKRTGSFTMSRTCGYIIRWLNSQDQPFRVGIDGGPSFLQKPASVRRQRLAVSIASVVGAETANRISAPHCALFCTIS